MKAKKLEASKATLARRWRYRRGTWWWAIAVIVVPVALIAAAAVTALLMFVDPGSDEKNRIELIKVGLTVGAGTGGVVALVLTGRRQWSTEHDNAERRLTELYVKAVEQLGSDKPAVRHGGLYALERVAQDNPDHRQVVVDVICAYLRGPYHLPGEPRPRNRPGIHRPMAPRGVSARYRAASRDQAKPPIVAQLDDDARQEREVRLTAQRILTTHLRPGDAAQHPAKTFWGGINLDLSGATLIDFVLTDCQMDSALFSEATFHGNAWFDQATFHGSAWFNQATFHGSAWFNQTTFHGSAWFTEATFHDRAGFTKTDFQGTGGFDEATFRGNAVFREATFHDDTGFYKANFHANAVFGEATFHDDTGFYEVNFHANAFFTEAAFYGNAGFTKTNFHGIAGFGKATFHDDTVFTEVTFHDRAGFDTTNFDLAPRAVRTRIRIGSAEPKFGNSSWPLGWTAEMSGNAEQVWVSLVPVPVVLVSVE